MPPPSHEESRRDFLVDILDIGNGPLASGSMRSNTARTRGCGSHISKKQWLSHGESRFEHKAGWTRRIQPQTQLKQKVESAFETEPGWRVKLQMRSSATRQIGAYRKESKNNERPKLLSWQGE